jgi:hypothetical protein
MQATQQALDALGAARPALALVFVSQEFVVADALSGLASLLGDTPTWGFSTLCPLTAEGDRPRTVLVALLAGEGLKAQVEWLPAFSQDAAGGARQVAQALRQAVPTPNDVLFVADGINASLGPLCAALGDLPVGVAGCTAAGEAALGKTFQIAQNQSGPGSLSLLQLGGSLCLGTGMAHGWRKVGAYFRATRTRDVWLHALDSAPAVDSYARYFGYTAREWPHPPLAEMARLYPLGVEGSGVSLGDAAQATAADGAMLVRSPLRVEVDGSLRMSAPVPEGAVVHLMVGDPAACLQAAQQAARDALAALHERSGGKAHPLLAVALVDVAWKYLFETHPTRVAAALKAALGDVPLAGAYTLGQVARPCPGAAPVVQNQNLQVVVFGDWSE